MSRAMAFGAIIFLVVSMTHAAYSMSDAELVRRIAECRDNDRCFNSLIDGNSRDAVRCFDNMLRFYADRTQPLENRKMSALVAMAIAGRFNQKNDFSLSSRLPQSVYAITARRNGTPAAGTAEPVGNISSYLALMVQPVQMVVAQDHLNIGAAGFADLYTRHHVGVNVSYFKSYMGDQGDDRSTVESLWGVEAGISLLFDYERRRDTETVVTHYTSDDRYSYQHMGSYSGVRQSMTAVRGGMAFYRGTMTYQREESMFVTAEATEDIKSDLFYGGIAYVSKFDSSVSRPFNNVYADLLFDREDPGAPGFRAGFRSGISGLGCYAMPMGASMEFGKSPFYGWYFLVSVGLSIAL